MKINLKKLPKSVEALEKIILLQQQEIEKHKKEIIAQKEFYIRLFEEFKLERLRRFSSSSEKNIFQSDLFDEPGIEIIGELKDQLDDTIDVQGYVRKKHPTRRTIPKDIPREIIIHDISDAEKICSCGTQLVKIGEEISEQIKYIPAQLSCIQHVRPKYACKPCQEHVRIAPMPQLLLPKSIATPELVAYTIIAKYCDHIPLYRQQAIWERFGIDVPRSSLCAWILKVAELCKPLVQLMQKKIINHDYVQADETTVQVLDEIGRDNKSKSYMWCYRGGGDKPNIIYEYQPTRSGYHAEQFLTGFKGFLQSDAYSGYNFADKNNDIIKVGCMAHARRKFADIVKITKTNGLAHEAIKYFRALYKIESDARDKKLLSNEKFNLRNAKSVAILNSFKSWLDTYLTKTPVQNKIHDAIRYTLSNWEVLNNFLKDGRIEIDNNLLENAIRPLLPAVLN